MHNHRQYHQDQEQWLLKWNLDHRSSNHHATNPRVQALRLVKGSQGASHLIPHGLEDELPNYQSSLTRFMFSKTPTSLLRLSGYIICSLPLSCLPRTEYECSCKRNTNTGTNRAPIEFMNFKVQFNSYKSN